MKFNVLFNPAIYNDIQEAIEWYNEQKPGLGLKFYNSLKRKLKALEKNALSYAIRYDDIRCMPLKKFPYMVHFRVDTKNKSVKVEAIFHTHRNPDIWNKRTRE